MSSAVRRSSYHLDVELRTALKHAQAAAAAASSSSHDNKEQEEQHYQQQPSPFVVEKKQVLVGADDEDDNNQDDQEETGRAAGITTARVVGKKVQSVVKPQMQAPKDAEKQLRHVQTLRKQAAQNSEPPLTTARLRQENTALKIKITQLSNQHEAQAQALQAQLTEAVATHDQYEHKMKKQVAELEKRNREAIACAKKFESQVESLTTKLNRLENKPALSLEKPMVPSPLTKTPFAAVLQRRGNGSPLPYGNQTKSSAVKPFAWRSEPTGRRMAAPPTSAPASAMRPGVNTNAYRRKNFSPQLATVAPLSARYIPVEPRILADDDVATTSSSVPELGSPSSPPKESTVATLAKRVSSNLISYCSELIASKLSQDTTATAEIARSPSPTGNKAKVMPAWMAQQLLLQDQRPMTGTPTAQAAPEDYTVINMPESSSPLTTPTHGSHLTSAAASAATTFLSQATTATAIIHQSLF